MLKSTDKVREVPERIAPEQSEPLRESPDINRREIYLLALLLQIKEISELEVSGEVFSDLDVREIFNRIVQLGSLDDNLDKLADELSDGSLEVLQKVLSTDLDQVTNPKEEFLRVYKYAYANYLRAQILNMRRTLNIQPESTELLNKLQFFTKELRSLEI